MKVQKKSKEKRRKIELNYVRSTDGLNILKLLAEGIPQSEIAKKCSFIKTKVNYWTKKFLKNGIIREKISGKPKFYQLTVYGTKILTGSDGDFPFSCVLEDYPFKFKIEDDFSDGRIDWVKVGKPKNWVKWGVILFGCYVERTTKNVIIHTGLCMGFDPNALVAEAGRKIERLKVVLENRGVFLSPIGFPLHKPIFRFYTSEAEVLNQFGTFYSENGSIDSSPPEKIPHIEWNLETAKNYLDMPNKINRIDKNLGRVSDSMLVFSRGMDEHMELINALKLASYHAKDSSVELKEVVAEIRDFMKILVSFFSILAPINPLSEDKGGE